MNYKNATASSSNITISPFIIRDRIRSTVFESYTSNEIEATSSAAHSFTENYISPISLPIVHRPVSPKSDKLQCSQSWPRFATEIAVQKAREDQLTENSGTVKTKIKALWNNMRYGWTLQSKTKFNNNKPIFMLGQIYHPLGVIDHEGDAHSLDDGKQSVELFEEDFKSRLWFTYRKDFAKLPNSTYTTDCGWGCMLRTGQMMLAQALVVHFLGRSWRMGGHMETYQQKLYHRQIISWFGDHPSRHAPFSIHRLVQVGEKLGRFAGEWYGPASTALIMKEAVRSGRDLHPLLRQIFIYVAQDCIIYKQDVLNLVTSPNVTKLERGFVSSMASSESSRSSSPENNSNWLRSVLILVPVRLGGEALNEIYIPCVKNMLYLKSCIGIIGGKPKHSVFFVGWQGEKLIHLDPHYCQDYVDTTTQDFLLDSYHCATPRKLPFADMDPSCTLGFLCKNETDFDLFCKDVQSFASPPQQPAHYPIFTIVEGEQEDYSQKLNCFQSEHDLTDDYIGIQAQALHPKSKSAPNFQKSSHPPKKFNIGSDSDSNDSFVLL